MSVGENTLSIDQRPIDQERLGFPCGQEASVGLKRVKVLCVLCLSWSLVLPCGGRDHPVKQKWRFGPLPAFAVLLFSTLFVSLGMKKEP